MTINLEAETLSLEDLISIITGEVNIMGTVSNIDPASLNEIKPKSNSISEIEVIKHNFNRIIQAKRVKRQPGVYCTALNSNNGGDCHFESEWDLNGNLYCESHFREQIKMCEDNGVGVNIN